MSGPGIGWTGRRTGRSSPFLLWPVGTAEGEWQEEEDRNNQKLLLLHQRLRGARKALLPNGFLCLFEPKAHEVSGIPGGCL